MKFVKLLPVARARDGLCRPGGDQHRGHAVRHRPAARSAFPRRTRSSSADEHRWREGHWIVLDDASDTTRAVTNTRRFITENKVDVVVGSTIHAELAGDGGRRRGRRVPMISMAASARIVDPANAKTPGVQDAAERLADGGRDRGAHEGQRREVDGLHRLRRCLRRRLAGGDQALAQTAGIKVVAEEKYNVPTRP